jgi:hypothetical protein
MQHQQPLVFGPIGRDECHVDILRYFPEVVRGVAVGVVELAQRIDQAGQAGPPVLDGIARGCEVGALERAEYIVVEDLRLVVFREIEFGAAEPRMHQLRAFRDKRAAVGGTPEEQFDLLNPFHVGDDADDDQGDRQRK